MLLRRWVILFLVAMALLSLIVARGPTRESDPAYWIVSLALIALPLILIFALRVRVFQAVKAGEIGVVERFHQLYDVAPPGLLPLLPFAEVARIIPTTEQIKQYPVAAVLTNDGVSIAFDLLVCYRVKRPTDTPVLRAIAEKVLYDVSDWHEAIKATAIGCLHQTVGAMPMTRVLGEWTTIGDSIKTTLQPSADDWGVDIRRVALMNPKISATLEAALEDPHKAQAEAIATEYRAGGEAQRLRLLSNGLQDSSLPNEVLTERYIQALERLSGSPSTHIVLPIELVRGLRELMVRNLPPPAHPGGPARQPLAAQPPAAGAPAGPPPNAARPAPAPGQVKPGQLKPAGLPQPPQPQPAVHPKPAAQLKPATPLQTPAQPQPATPPKPSAPAPAPPQPQPAVQPKPAAQPAPAAPSQTLVQPRPANPPKPAAQTKPAAQQPAAAPPKPTAQPQAPGQPKSPPDSEGKTG